MRPPWPRGHNTTMRYLTAGVANVLVATDFTAQAQRACDVAVRFARSFDARLHILHVKEERAFFGAGRSDTLQKVDVEMEPRRAEWMEKLAADAHAQGVDARVVMRSGMASAIILDLAEELDAGVTAIGTTGVRGLRRLMLTGSTAKKVLRKAKRPVLSVSAEAEVLPITDGSSAFSHVLYPLDNSPASKDGLAVAELLVARTGARLTLVHVLRVPTIIPSFPGEPLVVMPANMVKRRKSKIVDRMEEMARGLAAPDVDVVVEHHPDVAEGIADIATQVGADIIAIPRHSSGSRGLDSYVFGRTAENLVKIAPAPVLIFNPMQ